MKTYKIGEIENNTELRWECNLCTVTLINNKIRVKIPGISKTLWPIFGKRNANEGIDEYESIMGHLILKGNHSILHFEISDNGKDSKILCYLDPL